MSASHVALFVIVSFAMLVTVHVLASVRLAAHSPRWNGFAALLIPPIFPYFAIKRRATAWLVVWSVCVIAYATSLALAIRWR